MPTASGQVFETLIVIRAALPVWSTDTPVETSCSAKEPDMCSTDQRSRQTDPQAQMTECVSAFAQAPGQWAEWDAKQASQQQSYQHMLARQHEHGAQQAQHVQQPSQQAMAHMQLAQSGDGAGREQSPPIPVPLVKKKRT